MNSKKLCQFLKESNAIEDVYDEVSLVQAVQAWDYLSKVKTMTALHIIKAHKILMNGHLSEDELGHFRTYEVQVGGRVAPNHSVVPSLILGWCYETNYDKISDPVGQHVAFEGIHPFPDGNGRIGRLLMNWQAVIKNKGDFIIFKNEEKYESYYPLFRYL